MQQSGLLLAILNKESAYGRKEYLGDAKLQAVYGSNLSHY